MTETKKEIRTIFRNASLAGAFNIIGYGVSFIVGVIIARLVGAKIYGIVALGLSMVNILQVFSTIGMDRALFKYISLFAGQDNFYLVKKSIYYALLISIVIATAIIVVFFLVYKNIISFFSNSMDELSSVLKYFIFIVPVLSINSLLSNSFTGLRKPHVIQLFNSNLRPIIRLSMLIVFMIWMSSRLQALVWSTILAYIICVVALLYTLWKILSKKFVNKDQHQLSNNVFDYTDFLKFSLPLALIPIFNLLTQQFDTLIVGHFLTASETGIYAVVRKVGALILMPLAMFGGIIVATISKFYAAGKRDMVADFYELGTKWIMFISGFIFVLFFTFSKELIALFGHEFTHGEGGLLLRIFIIGQLINASVGPSGNLLLILNKNVILVLISLFAGIMSTVLSFILIPKYKLIGAGISLAFTFTLINLFSIMYIYFFFKIKATTILNYLKRFFIIGVTLLISMLCNKYFIFIKIIELKMIVFSILIFFVLLILIRFIEGITNKDKYILEIIHLKFQKINK